MFLTFYEAINYQFIKITAESDCNIHGSGGIAKAQVAIK